MLRLGKWNGEAVRKKFARYRLWFALSSLLFLLVTAAEMIWFGAGIRAFPGSGFRTVFTGLLTGEGAFFLVTFLLGVTVYAPVWQLAASILRGFAAGFVLSSLLPVSGGKEGMLFGLTGLYLLLSSLWYFTYASFCTCVAMRIFSSHSERSAAGEERLFGGSLFFAEAFCGSVNLRFLFSYTSFFFAAAIGAAGLAAGFAFVRTAHF